MTKTTFTCDDTATCGMTTVAKIEAGSDLKYTKVLFRRIRIRLLDCRSGKPIKGMPIGELKVDDSPVVRFKWTDRSWDISRHFPLFADSNDGGNWHHGTRRVVGARATLKGKGAAAQMALAAMGYDEGLSPYSDSFGRNGRKRMWEYLNDRGIPKKDLPPYQPERGEEWQPEDAWLDAVLWEYNSRCFRTAGLCLAARGFFPNSQDPLSDSVVDEHDDFMDDRHVDRWTEKWIEAFHTWQKTQYGVANPWDWVKNSKWGKLLRDEKSPYVTNQNGDLFVPVPASKFKQSDGFTIEISFRDFPIVAEATEKELGEKSSGVICRTNFSEDEEGRRSVLPRQNEPPGFAVEWVDREQEEGSEKPWGWRLRPSRAQSAKEREAFAEFKSSWKFSVPKAPDFDKESKLSLLGQIHAKHKCFSCFYGPNEPEFVVFAMRWCQPVWDGIDDPPRKADPQYTDKAYIPADSASNNMHIVSLVRDLNGTEDYGGKYLGILEHRTVGTTKWRGDEGHFGYDVYGVRGTTKVFAVHGGKATTHDDYEGSVQGNNVKLFWQGSRGYARFLHLDSFEIEDDVRVLAGQVIGIVGRTGNLGDVSEWPSHVHLDVGIGTVNQEATWNKLYKEPDDANKACIPHQESPLLYPCRCDVTRDGRDPKNCKFGDEKHDLNDTRFVDQCWAVSELCCPEMPKTLNLADTGYEGKKEANRRLQAQLRYLHEHLDADKYTHPGTLDGKPGKVPTDENPNPNDTRTALYWVKFHNELLPDGPATFEQKYGIDQPLIDKLEKLAKVKSPSG